MSFAEELANWGPGAGGSAAVDLEAARAYCRHLAHAHYENFPVVTWFLPRRLRPHFYALYAYCRWSDDLADEAQEGETHDPARSLELLAWWRGELSECFAGRASHPVFVALGPTIAEFSIPKEPFEDLLSAFEQDQRVLRYATFDELVDYCRRSANPVGRLVLYLCGHAREETFRWSDSICTGLQLANFWQDVSRDLTIGRVYLPDEDLKRFSYTRDQLLRRTTNDAFLQLMQFEVARARTFLRPWGDAARGELRPLPFRVQVDIELFARGGERILDRIEAIGYRVWDTRPVVTRGDFARLFVACFWRAVLRNLRSV
jgi:squalene synthase HpnC